MPRINGYVSGNFVGFAVDYTVSQSIDTNTSTVNYSGKVWRTNSGYVTQGHFNFNVTINGSTRTHSVYVNVSRAYAEQQVFSGSITIPHDADGTKAFNLKVYAHSPGVRTISMDTQVTLPTIPRASSVVIRDVDTPTQTRDYAYPGASVLIDIERASPSFTHDVLYTFMGQTIAIAYRAAWAREKWLIPTSFIEQMANVEQSTLILTVKTYAGNGTVIGTRSTSFVVKVPEYIKPTLSHIVTNEGMGQKLNIIGASPFCQLISKIKVDFQSAGVHGSWMTHWRVSLGNQTNSGEQGGAKSTTFENVNLSGNIPLKITVTDSRGRSATETRTVYLKPYSKPSIDLFDAYRNRNNSRFSTARIAVSCTPFVENNKNLSPTNVLVEISEKDKRNWTKVYDVDLNATKFNRELAINSPLDDYKAYDVRLTVKDKFYHHVAYVTIPVASSSFIMGADSEVIGVNMIPTINRGLQSKYGFYNEKGERVDGETTPWVDIPLIGASGRVSCRFFKGVPYIKVTDLVARQAHIGWVPSQYRQNVPMYPIFCMTKYRTQSYYINLAGGALWFDTPGGTGGHQVSSPAYPLI